MARKGVTNLTAGGMIERPEGAKEFVLSKMVGGVEYEYWFILDGDRVAREYWRGGQLQATYPFEDAKEMRKRWRNLTRTGYTWVNKGE
jgi:hypothetical protein